jgi:hypothetical protein
LLLEPWTIEFDPEHEPVSQINVLEILLGLPLELCTRATMGEIGDKLGSFVGLEPNWTSKKDRHWAWIQVEVNVRDGIIGNLYLV